jgi:predicted secreted Zn-dependent protease
VRARLQAYVIETVADHEAASRAFDKTEWGEDGAMRKLVLELVNGP